MKIFYTTFFIQVPDYYDLIKTPVDLTSIRNKIDSIEYDSAYDFVKDMVLLFSNCESYNTVSYCYMFSFK